MATGIIRFETIVIITVRKRSLGPGNVLHVSVILFTRGAVLSRGMPSLAGRGCRP